MKPSDSRSITTRWIVFAVGSLLLFQLKTASAPPTAQDPGVRPGAADAGDPLPNLTTAQLEYFAAGHDEFTESESVDEGLGPRMNLDSCGGCHSQPAIGGSSPAANPQFVFAPQDGARDLVPPFILPNGPVREARFVQNHDGTLDGGVHPLFTISGRPGAAGCSLTQPDFAAELAAHNVIFRIPTPVFGAGMIEQIPDAAILANRASDVATKSALGVRGRANFSVSGRTISGQTNNNGNDGTIARFGWKAQNKSLLIFAGEAYNVEMGITNELFQTERDETSPCQSAPVPNSITDTEAATTVATVSAIEKFAMFMRFLAPPTASATTPGGASSIDDGRETFAALGCALCHTASFTTGNSAIAQLRNQQVRLFSDLLVHDMGDGLADGVNQGEANGREFRTAPLWGLGKRLFFLHDGRASDLIAAISAHASAGSEANEVVANFAHLNEIKKQDLLNFLRSL
jgi:CxxC motif-containing protein (DUF1111 family)